MLDIIKHLIVSNSEVITAGITSLVAYLIRKWERARLIKHYSKNGQQ